MKSTTKLLVLLSALALSACGFHLRNANNIPSQFNYVYIDSVQLYGPLEKILRETFKSYDITVVNSDDAAKVILKIINQNVTSNSQAISTSTQVTQFNLLLTVTYEVRDSKNDLIIPQQNVSVTRSYTINANQLTGTNSQQDVLVQVMRRDAVFLITNQLSSTRSHVLFEQAFAPHATQ